MVILTDCRIDQVRAHRELADNLVFRASPHAIRKLIKKECLVRNNWLQQKEFFDFFIVGGDWDKDHSWVCEDRNFVEMKELIAVREDFRSSASYRRCVDELHKGIPQKGIDKTPFTSVAGIDEAFSYYLNLIVSMETVGYIPKLETRKSEGERHIGVGIARDGELFHFRTGHHRLAIGRLLNLESVMVQVHCVHSQWAEAALRQYGGSELDAIRSAVNNLAKESVIG